MRKRHQRREVQGRGIKIRGRKGTEKGGGTMRAANLGREKDSGRGSEGTMEGPTYARPLAAHSEDKKERKSIRLPVVGERRGLDSWEPGRQVPA